MGLGIELNSEETSPLLRLALAFDGVYPLTIQEPNTLVLQDKNVTISVTDKEIVINPGNYCFGEFSPKVFTQIVQKLVDLGVRRARNYNLLGTTYCSFEEVENNPALLDITYMSAENPSACFIVRTDYFRYACTDSSSLHGVMLLNYIHSFLSNYCKNVKSAKYDKNGGTLYTNKGFVVEVKGNDWRVSKSPHPLENDVIHLKETSFSRWHSANGLFFLQFL